MKCGNGRAARAVLMGLTGAWLATTPAGARPGDLNNNNGLDSGDVKIALQIAGGRTNGAGQIATGDVAGPAGNTPDGKITILDAVRIARAANGLDDLGGGGTPGALAVATQQAVTIAGATTKNFQLPPGYLLSGTVKDTAGNSITNNANPLNSTNGSIRFDNPASPSVSAGGNVAANAGYSAVVAPGANNATVLTGVQIIDITTGDFSRYTVGQTPTPASVSVNGTKTQAFVRPDLPVPGTLAGSITGGSVDVATISIGLTNGGSATAFPDGDSYSMKVPPGAGTVSFSGTLAANEDVTVSAYLASTPQTVQSGKATTYNITIPALATLGGTVTLPSGVSPAFASLANVTSNGLTGYSSFYSMTSGAYVLAGTPGSYNLSFAMAGIKSGASTLTWGYNTPVTLAAGSNTKNLTLPSLPATYTVQGTVTGPDGKPVSGADISAILSAGASSWYAMGDTTTAANGVYSLKLPAGSYTFFITPPAPGAGG